MSRRLTLSILTTLFCLATLSAFAYDDKDADVKGMIKARAGELLLVQTGSGDVTVVLTDDTVTKDDRGLFGLEKQKMGDTVLIPGLKIKVDGTQGTGGKVIAKTITVDGDDLETSQMIAAGMHPTAQQVEANVKRLEAHEAGIASNKQATEKNAGDISANRQQIESNIKDLEEHEQRFAKLDDYDVKGEATIKFASASTKITPEDEKQLKDLADKANQMQGVMVEVTGFADARGNPAMNTKLSEDRAKAVITYLVQQCGVPMRRLVAPGAMGEYGAAATNETKAGRAENRRVEVKVLVNKGIAAENMPPR